MMWNWGNSGWGWGWGWGMWLTMMLFMLAFLAVAVWAVVMLTRSGTSRPPNHDHVEHASDPKRILDERFARGDIDEDEYRKRKDVLQEKK